MGNLQFHGAWPAWLTITFAVAISAFAWWLYYRETRTLSGLNRWLLPCLRSTAILLAMLMLIEPSCHRRWQEGEPASLDIVLDLSESMSLQENNNPQQSEASSTALRSAVEIDPTETGVRLQRVDQYLLSGATPLLQQWSETHEVRVRTLVNDELATVWQSNVQQTPTLPTSVMDWQVQWGKVTALGTGMRNLVPSNVTGTQASREGLADSDDTMREANRSVLLVSDGQHNSGPGFEIATQLKSVGMKIHAVGLGPRREDRDLSVLDVAAPQTAYFTDSISGKIQWQDRMESNLDGSESVKLQIRAVRAGDDSDLIQLAPLWEQDVTIDGTGNKETTFRFPVNDLVTQLRKNWRDVDYAMLPITFQVTLSDLASERSDRNNHFDFQVAVGTRRQKVLLIDGRSRWEIRFLRNSLERDPNWQVDSFLWDTTGLKTFSQGNADAVFPETLDQLLHYDLIVLGEIEPNLLPGHLQNWIQQFVSATGGGLFVIDGSRNYWNATKLNGLRELLPIRSIGDVKNDGRAMQVQLTQQGQWLPVMQIANSPEDSQQVWQQLPGMKHVAVVEVLPGGETLANLVDADQQSYPYLVTRLFGSGRVLYAASDESWRWRYVVEDQFHQRFWNQAARWVMRSPFMVQTEWLSLDTGQIFYEPDQAIRLRARLMDIEGKPSQLESIDGLIRLAQTGLSSDNRERRISMRPVPEYPGVYEGQLPSLPPAEYQFMIQAPGYQQSVLDLSAKFIVNGQAINEFADLTCNETWLKQLCESTGGRYVHESEAGLLLNFISESSNGRFIETDTLLWQSYLWFIPIVGLLGFEWWRRKQAGLI